MLHDGAPLRAALGPSGRQPISNRKLAWNSLLGSTALVSLSRKPASGLRSRRVSSASHFAGKSPLRGSSSRISWRPPSSSSLRSMAPFTPASRALMRAASASCNARAFASSALARSSCSALSQRPSHSSAQRSSHQLPAAAGGGMSYGEQGSPRSYANHRNATTSPSRIPSGVPQRPAQRRSREHGLGGRSAAPRRVQRPAQPAKTASTDGCHRRSST